jgi:hypothetical protein
VRDAQIIELKNEFSSGSVSVNEYFEKIIVLIKYKPSMGDFNYNSHQNQFLEQFDYDSQDEDTIIRTDNDVSQIDDRSEAFYSSQIVSSSQIGNSYPPINCSQIIDSSQMNNTIDSSVVTQKKSQKQSVTCERCEKVVTLNNDGSMRTLFNKSKTRCI